MKNTFRSLAGRDFRLYYLGQFVSLLGTWVQQVAFALLVVSGCGTLIVVTSSNILLQSLAPDNLREQVMALYSMCFIGILPLASLVTGGIAHVVGVEPVFVLAGLLFAGLGAVMQRKLPYLRELAHPILRKKGLVQE